MSIKVFVQPLTQQLKHMVMKATEKIIPVLMIDNKFELDYLQRIWTRDNSNNNEFMNGQTECAKHAQTIIGELLMKIQMLEAKKISQ